MGTRSTIGIVNSDGSVEAVYCHWDGYPSHNGKILLSAYKDEAKVRELVALGSLSTLGEEIGEKHDFDSHNKNEAAAKWCLFYGRDRGESDVGAQRHPTVGAAKKDMEEYLYLFCDGKWTYSDHGGDIIPLTAETCEKD